MRVRVRVRVSVRVRVRFRVRVSLGAAGVGLDLHGGVVRGLAVPCAQLDLQPERLVGGRRAVEEVGRLGAA